MNRPDQAANLFDQGYSCSQSILAIYGPPLGLEKQLALKSAAGFGGGIGCMGTLCGALGGLFIAIGLKYGTTDPSDKDTKMKTYDIVTNAADKFEKQYGSINCRDLLGFDLSTPRGQGTSQNRRQLRHLHKSHNNRRPNRRRNTGRNVITVK